MPQVIEIMRVLPIESITGAPPLVCGLCVIRGGPVAVIDTALLFGRESLRSERLITVRTGNRTVAFAAEAVLGVQFIQQRQLLELPPILSNVDAIAAVTTLDQELMFFLQTARIIPDDFLVGANAERVEP